MTFEEAFRKILFNYGDIQPNIAYDYLYEIEGVDDLLTEEEVIKFAENL